MQKERNKKDRRKKLQILTLNRFYINNKVTIGRIKISNQAFCTIERGWKDNQVNVSCIPEGEYSIYPHKSPKFGDVYIIFGGTVGYSVSDTVKRTHCLIHVGNSIEDVNGCIALGLHLSFPYNNPTITDSKQAMNLFKDLLKYKEAKLIIKGV